MILDEPLSDAVQIAAGRALFRARGEPEGAATALATMLRIRPDLLDEVAGAIVRTAHRAQLWDAQSPNAAGGEP